MCGSIMRHVFGRSGGPQDATHHARRGGNHRRSAACRLIVTPDPEGTNHRFETVPHDVSVEALIDERRAYWKRQVLVGVA